MNFVLERREFRRLEWQEAVHESGYERVRD
jgi:hypothetical protein